MTTVSTFTKEVIMLEIIVLWEHHEDEEIESMSS